MVGLLWLNLNIPMLYVLCYGYRKPIIHGVNKLAITTCFRLGVLHITQDFFIDFLFFIYLFFIDIDTADFKNIFFCLALL